MNDHSLRIDQYLQNEMSADERASFEAALLSDDALRAEFEVQQLILNAAYDAGVKSTFKNALRRKTITKRWVVGICSAVPVILLIIFAVLHLKNSKTANSDAVDITAKSEGKRFIHPPLEGVDVPFAEHSFDAQKGDTVYAPSGSVVVFPASSVLDEHGAKISGQVTVRYREFRKPVDFFVSGITMQYDSSNQEYDFESAGMIELNVYQKNKPVFVNPDAAPEVFLSGSNDNPKQNLYYLDTVKKSWVYEGKDKIFPVKTLAAKAIAQDVPINANNDEEPVKPVMPVRASGDRPTFSIEIQPGSFRELFAYDKLRFEPIDLQEFKGSDADEEWSDVKLTNISQGIYRVTFSNVKRTVSYKVRPVLEGDSYDDALKKFKEQNSLYEQHLMARLNEEKQRTGNASAPALKLQGELMLQQQTNAKLNNLLESRNRALRKNAAGFQQQEQGESQVDPTQLNVSRLTDMVRSTEVIRNFAIRRFGIWNCDEPIIQKAIPLYITFTDEQGKQFNLTYGAVVYKDFNGIAQFESSNTIRVVPNTGNMIWGIAESKLYYYSYGDFAAAEISQGTTKATFRMRGFSEPITSYKSLAAMVEKMTAKSK